MQLPHLITMLHSSDPSRKHPLSHPLQPKARHSPLFPQHHRNTIPNRQPKQSRLEKIIRNAPIPSLPALLSGAVSHHVKIPAHTPSETHHRARKRELDTGQQESSEHTRLVLDVVGMCTLCAVEVIRFLVGAAGGRVGRGVGDCGGFAEFARVGGVDCV